LLTTPQPDSTPTVGYSRPPRIVAVIPARNEASVIGKSIASLLRQTCIDTLQIFVVDDNSSDGTAEAVRSASTHGAHGSRASVINGRPLPPGWSGKLWAVQQGIEQAAQLNPDFLLLTDADIEHAPDNIARLVAIAKDGSYDLASFMVKLHCRSFAEKLLIPAFVFFFLLLYPPQWIRDPRRKTAGAAGGCILIRPAALARAGGMEAIRHEIIDDCALARAVKQTGGRVWLGMTADTRSLRAYNSFAEIEHMIARTAFNQLRHSVWLLIATVLAMLIVFVLPLALLFSGSLLRAAIGGIVYLLLSATYFPMIRFYRLNPLWALTLPCSAVFYVGATIHSAFKYWSGRGGEWKGRTQDAARR
jgi:hopene-associated glycosyltransferase HpnB